MQTEFENTFTSKPEPSFKQIARPRLAFFLKILMFASRRELLLTLYRWMTRARRAQLTRSFESACAFPACILFYHRVSNQTINGWSIRAKNFERQMNWIKQNATPSSLDEIRLSQLKGSRSKAMVGVTFDDGYGENCEFAIPFLVERKIPVTYFVSTHYVETGEPFPHDIANGKVLRPNTIAEVKRMAADGVEIGAHSHTHLDFGKPLGKKQLKIEINDVRKKLQDWTGQSIDYFAFPYGLKANITQGAIDAVFEAGHKSFVCAAGGFNLPGGKANHLVRCHGEPGFAAFMNWLTFDPRKVFGNSPINFQNHEPQMPTLPQRTLVVPESSHAVLN